MIITTKKIDGIEVVDLVWLRSLSDEQLEERLTNLHNAMRNAQAMFLDMRDAMLKVLVKHDLCPNHWLTDGCPIEIYGKQEAINSQFEIFQKKLIKENMNFRDKFMRWEQSVEYQAWLRRNKNLNDELESNDKTT